MFTGIISAIGIVHSLERQSEGMRVVIETSPDDTINNQHWSGGAIAEGASIACDGICLTLIEASSVDKASHHRLIFDASPETLAKTTLSNWGEGSKVNLERALTAGDELGGHIVSGHVDGLGRVSTITDMGDARKIEITAFRNIAHLIAPKGSVTVDGVSLTVNDVRDGGVDEQEGASFDVMIVPYTLKHTTLGGCKAGDEINLEADMLARYVARIQSSNHQSSN